MRMCDNNMVCGGSFFHVADGRPHSLLPPGRRFGARFKMTRLYILTRGNELGSTFSAYNLFALPFVAGLLYPFTEWTLPPAFAGLMMAFSLVSVVASSLLLRTYIKPVINDDGRLDERGCASCHTCFVGCLFDNPLCHIFGRNHKRLYGYPLENDELELTDRIIV